jgi:hypothetical protein
MAWWVRTYILTYIALVLAPEEKTYQVLSNGHDRLAVEFRRASQVSIRAMSIFLR